MSSHPRRRRRGSSRCAPTSGDTHLGARFRPPASSITFADPVPEVQRMRSIQEVTRRALANALRSRRNGRMTELSVGGRQDAVTCRSSPPTASGPKHLVGTVNAVRRSTSFTATCRAAGLGPVRQRPDDRKKKTQRVTDADIEEVILVAASTADPRVARSRAPVDGRQGPEHDGEPPNEVPVAIGRRDPSGRFPGRGQDVLLPRRSHLPLALGVERQGGGADEVNRSANTTKIPARRTESSSKHGRGQPATVGPDIRPSCKAKRETRRRQPRCSAVFPPRSNPSPPRGALPADRGGSTFDIDANEFLDASAGDKDTGRPAAPINDSAGHVELDQSEGPSPHARDAETPPRLRKGRLREEVERARTARQPRRHQVSGTS